MARFQSAALVLGRSQTLARNGYLKHLVTPATTVPCRCLSSKDKSEHWTDRDSEKKRRRPSLRVESYGSQSYDTSYKQDRRRNQSNFGGKEDQTHDSVYKQDRRRNQSNFGWKEEIYSGTNFSKYKRQSTQIYDDNFHQFNNEEMPQRNRYRNDTRKYKYSSDGYNQNQYSMRNEEKPWGGKSSYNNKRKYKKSKDPSVTYPEDNDLSFISSTISMPKKDTSIANIDVDVVRNGYLADCNTDEASLSGSEVEAGSHVDERLRQNEVNSRQSFDAEASVDEDEWEYDPDEEFNLDDISLLTEGFKPNVAQTDAGSETAKKPPDSAESSFPVDFLRDSDDTFGTLASDLEKWELQTKTEQKDYVEEERAKRKPPLARYNRRHVPHWYARRIQKLGKEGKVREAITVFDTWMIEQDRVKPTMFEFGCLMTILGHAGYTEKAFALYEQMKETVNHVHGHVYTGLFTACANSPWPEDGLKRAHALHKEMCEKRVRINFINYMAMIQAFGRLGDVGMAFMLAEQAVRRNLNDRQRNNVLCALLTASIADKQSGFRHAVLAWRHIQKLGVKPDVRMYNLLLRVVKECGIGDPVLTTEHLGGQAEDIPLLESGTQTTTDTATQEYPLSTDTHRSTEEVLPVINAIDIICKHPRQQKSGKGNFKKGFIRSKRQIDSVVQKYSISHDIDAGEINVGQEEQFLHKEDDQSLEAEHDMCVELCSENTDISDTKEWWEEDLFSVAKTDEVLNTNTTLQLNTQQIQFVDILDPASNLPSNFDVRQIKTASDRLNLLGGMHGFRERLQRCSIDGQIVAFTLLIDCVPDTMDNDLLVAMQIAGVTPDTDFYNHLIQKKTRRFAHKEALDVFARIRSEGLVPNERTFGCIAMACSSPQDGLGLLKEMQSYDMEPNIKVLTALLRSARLFDFQYTSEILKEIKRLGHKPDRFTIAVMENRIEKMRNLLHKQPDKTLLQERLQKFISFYNNWLKYSTMGVEEDPWRSFKVKEAETK